MFDDGWDGFDPDVEPPPDGEMWTPWEGCDDDSWIDEIAALDPERELTVAEILHAAEHGPVEQIPLAALAGLDPQALTDDQQIALLVGYQRVENHGVGGRLRTVGVFAGPDPSDDRGEAAFAWTDLSAALHVGEGTARTMASDARRLRSHLPATLAGLVDGELSWFKARTLLEATNAMTAEQCAQVEDRVLEHAGRRSNSQHSSSVRYHAQRVDPDGWRHRREQQLKDTAVIRRLHGDGIADLLVRNADALQVETMWRAADTWARQQKANGDPRTLDALRVAAFYDFACRYLTGQPLGAEQTPGAAPTRNGAAATVNVFITLPDAIAAAHGDTTATATIADTGEPLPADAVAELLHAGARIRFALTDGAGRLVGISTTLHDPPALTRAWVALRDVSIRVPGGSVTPVAGQDLDHLDETGPTEPGNLHPPSRGWHRAKTFRHWTVHANPDGTITWTSRRTHRSYTTHPYNHRAGP